jgi:hypothetical protein
MIPQHSTLKPFLFLLVVLLIASCSAERKLAVDFYRNRQSKAVLVIPADFIYKRNLKAFEIEDARNMEDHVLDSVLFSESLFVQHISDSIFLETFTNRLIKGLRNIGLRVYLQPDTDLFFEDPSDKYIINVAQLLLEEDVELLFDPDYDPEYRYLGDFYLNNVILSSWFEVSGVNDNGPKTEVAFAEMIMSDQFDGRLRYFPFTGNLIYTYSVDSVKTDDVYTLASTAGKQYSGYLFDYLMNRYVDRTIPPGKSRTVYYRYDFSTRMLKQAHGERFEFIE